MDEYPDPRVDETITLRCVNKDCFMFFDPEGERGETFHPTLESEYQGVVPHGGMVDFFTDDSHDCPECGVEGEEI